MGPWPCHLHDHSEAAASSAIECSNQCGIHGELASRKWGALIANTRVVTLDVRLSALSKQSLCLVDESPSGRADLMDFGYPAG